MKQKRRQDMLYWNLVSEINRKDNGNNKNYMKEMKESHCRSKLKKSGKTFTHNKRSVSISESN